MPPPGEWDIIPPTRDKKARQVATSTGSSARPLPESAAAAGDAGARLLIVDDDAELAHQMARVLAAKGHRVDIASTGSRGLELLRTGLYDVVLLDVVMPPPDGFALLDLGPTLQPDARFIIITGGAGPEPAVEAMKRGAFDYLTKPIEPTRLEVVIQQALRELDQTRRLAHAGAHASLGSDHDLIGTSPAMERLRNLIARVAPTRTSVLITGETGTGKELVARRIHALSDRRHAPFVPVHCGALPESLLESELFGHVKGSFTGATDHRRGLFEEAADGTLFLDEVGTLPKSIQVKLLRALQDRRITRVGSNQEVPVRFRLVAATNAELWREVTEGRFRDDLYYRLNVFPIRVPPLRDRGNDVLVLAGHFCRRYAREIGLAEVPGLSPGLIRRMAEYPWPGNVRELENFIQRAVITHPGAKELPAELPAGVPTWPAEEPPPIERAVAEAWTLAELEREYILRVYERCGHRVGQAAAALGIDRRTLSRKLAAAGFASRRARGPAGRKPHAGPTPQ